MTRYGHIRILLVMGTSVHIPPSLLAAVDKRAEQLGLSRNRYIVRALERALEAETGWSPAFREELESARTDREGIEALEEMRRALACSRRSKTAPPRSMAPRADLRSSMPQLGSSAGLVRRDRDDR